MFLYSTLHCQPQSPHPAPRQVCRRWLGGVSAPRLLFVPRWWCQSVSLLVAERYVCRVLLCVFCIALPALSSGPFVFSLFFFFFFLLFFLSTIITIIIFLVSPQSAAPVFPFPARWLWPWPITPSIRRSGLEKCPPSHCSIDIRATLPRPKPALYRVVLRCAAARQPIFLHDSIHRRRPLHSPHSLPRSHLVQSWPHLASALLAATAPVRLTCPLCC